VCILSFARSIIAMVQSCLKIEAQTLQFATTAYSILSFRIHQNSLFNGLIVAIVTS